MVEDNLGFFRVEIEMALEGLRELEEKGEDSPKLCTEQLLCFLAQQRSPHFLAHHKLKYT